MTLPPSSQPAHRYRTNPTPPHRNPVGQGPPYEMQTPAPQPTTPPHVGRAQARLTGLFDAALDLFDTALDLLDGTFDLFDATFDLFDGTTDLFDATFDHGVG